MKPWYRRDNTTLSRGSTATLFGCCPWFGSALGVWRLLQLLVKWCLVPSSVQVCHFVSCLASFTLTGYRTRGVWVLSEADSLWEKSINSQPYLLRERYEVRPWPWCTCLHHSNSAFNTFKNIPALNTWIVTALTAIIAYRNCRRWSKNVMSQMWQRKCVDYSCNGYICTECGSIRSAIWATVLSRVG